MRKSRGVADLHLHTTASDGTCSVETRVQQAQKEGLNAIAITDHDTIANDINYRETQYTDTKLISGVEIRADVLDTKVEILGYYIDPNDNALANLLQKVRSYRRDRNQKIIDQLNESTSFDQSYTDIRANVNGILGRPHIAKILVRNGIVDTISEAFEIYLGSHGTVFVPMERVSAKEVIETVQNAGGVASLAHPGRIRTDSIDSIIDRLVDYNLDGIEVPYPYQQAPNDGYADIGVKDANGFAERFDLLQTGGSDCHGPGSGKFRLGNVRVSGVHLNALRKRADEHRHLESHSPT